MTVRSPTYVSFLAGGAIGPNRIVKIGAADNTVILGAAATDAPVGVSAMNITAASGDRVDVCIEGVYEIIAGGTITRGARITTDAAGAAVAAAPGAGTNNGIVGTAMASAVAGDFVSVQIAPGLMQG